MRRGDDDACMYGTTTQHHAAPRSTTQHHAAASRSITQHHAAPCSTTQHSMKQVEATCIIIPSSHHPIIPSSHHPIIHNSSFIIHQSSVINVVDSNTKETCTTYYFKSSQTNISILIYQHILYVLLLKLLIDDYFNKTKIYSVMPGRKQTYHPRPPLPSSSWTSGFLSSIYPLSFRYLSSLLSSPPLFPVSPLPHQIYKG